MWKKKRSDLARLERARFCTMSRRQRARCSSISRRIGRIVSTPLVKFSTHTVAYLCFLAALFLQSVFAQAGVDHEHTEENLAWIKLFSNCTSERSDLRHTGTNSADMFIIILLIGMFWGEVKQIWVEGCRRYLASGWNWIDICMLNLYIGSYCTKAFAHIRNDNALDDAVMQNMSFCCAVRSNQSSDEEDFYFLFSDRQLWSSRDPIFVSEALFAFANVLSFSRLSYILPINEFLGPLQISLGRMIGDILRFGAVFTVVFLAFFCSFLNLYYSMAEEGSFGTFMSTLLNLFWALFGMAESTATEIEAGFKLKGNDFAFTESVGTVMFAAYHIIMSLVMLNMLIAMMSNSFQEIESDEDVEWKFARAKLWMSYFEKGATLPIPFNIVPSPKSFCRIYHWIVHPIGKHFCKRAVHMRKPNIHLKERRSEVYNIVTMKDSTKIEKFSHQNMMKDIVKRYLFQLQRSQESDEVNEGELEEIKNDISSLRFELLEILTLDSNTQDVNTGTKSAKLPNRTVNATSQHVETIASVSKTGSKGSTKYERNQGSAENQFRLSRVSANLIEGNKIKLENIEEKVEMLSEEFASMKNEILKALGASFRKSVQFKDDDS